MDSGILLGIFWKLAVVQDLIVGEDQQVRAAIVKVSDPQGNTRLLRRSVKHLYPIEVRNDTEESQTPNKEENTVTVHSVADIILNNYNIPLCYTWSLPLPYFHCMSFP